MTDRLPVPMPGTDIVPHGWYESVVLPWADEQANGKDLREASAKLAGFAVAYRLMDGDAIEFEKARRVLEVRLGELLGEGKRGQPGQAISHAREIDGGLDRNERHRFRQLAANRRGVLALLKKATREEEVTRAALLKRFAPPRVVIPHPEGDILRFADLCERITELADEAVFALWAYEADVPIPEVVMDSLRDAVTAIQNVMKELEKHG